MQVKGAPAGHQKNFLLFYRVEREGLQPLEPLLCVDQYHKLSSGNILEKILKLHPNLERAGTEDGPPHWLINLQSKVGTIRHS